MLLYHEILRVFLSLLLFFKREGIWFDISQVNLDDPKKHSDSNFEVLQTWIDQIMSGAISLDGKDFELL